VAGWTIVLDFDGTITEEDMLDRIALEFGDRHVFREVDDALESGRMTLHEVLRREYEPVRATLDEVLGWALPRTAVRPGLADLVRLAEERGWRVVVLSSGFRELIDPVLVREGLAGLEIVANSVAPGPDGWRVAFRDTTVCERCGEPCKRRSLEQILGSDRSGRVAYVGDGNSDRCAAETADLVFARRGLSAYLTRKGVPFEPFEDFFDVANTLLTESS
jgi:2,3-diketo-5-methylthio-1-phosphopentane phosphatase